MGRILFLVIIAGFAGALGYALYPGLVPPDGFFQYLQVRSGEISNLHPPIMVHLWGVLEAYVIEGPAGPFMLAWAIYSAAVWIIATTLSPRLISRILIATFCFAPPVIAVMMSVWKDAFMLAFLMMSVACLMRIATKPHILWGLLLLVCVWMAAAMRHNAILSIIPIVGCMLYLLPRVRCAWCLAAKTLVLCGLIAVSVDYVNRHNVTTVSMLPTVALWDLAAMSVEEKQVLIPDYARRNKFMNLFQLEQLFDPITNTPLCRYVPASGREVYCVEEIPLRAGTGLPSDKVEPLTMHWIQTIGKYPMSYVRHRLNVTCHLLDVCRPIDTPQKHIGFNVNTMQPSSMSEAWYSGPSPSAMSISYFKTPGEWGQKVVNTLTNWRANSVIMSSWPYMLLMVLVSFLFAFFQPAGKRRAVALCLLASGWLMALPLIVIVPNFQLRYLIWPIVCALLSFCMLRKPPRTRPSIDELLDKDTRSGVAPTGDGR